MFEERVSGILLHPSSLPGPHGSGDLGPSAYHFVDWLLVAGQKLWQWLPTVHSGELQAQYSPYMALTAFGGSPLLVALEPLVDRGWLRSTGEPGFRAGRIEFSVVDAWRTARLREAWSGFEAGASDDDRSALSAWTKDNASWLDDYALFMSCQGAHAGRPWWEWAQGLASRSAEALERARAEYSEEMRFWRFVQWCFDWQCIALKSYAEERGVEIVGDLPLFVARNSVDLWVAPELFVLDDAGRPTWEAGVPPDPIAPDGQKWELPLYRWDKMAEDGFGWWIRRVRRTLRYCSRFRIDHFRGLAAYWEIPADARMASEGRWARGPGKAFLDAVTAAVDGAPIIAEDLAFIVTEDVHALRRQYGIPGMKVLLYAFGGDARNDYLPHNFAPDCVAYTGTHDNDTARGAWDSASWRDRRFMAAYLGTDGSDVHWCMIRSLAASVARTVIFPFQDVLGLGSEHRMNVAGTVSGANWSWRFEWSMVGPDPARILAEITSSTGRCAFEKLGVGAPFAPPGPPAVDDPWKAYPF
jgi:4-alpha-glucanotransferase